MKIKWDQILTAYDNDYHILEGARIKYRGFSGDLADYMKKYLEDNLKDTLVSEQAGISITHEKKASDNGFYFLESTISTYDRKWFKVTARIANPWSNSPCPQKLHIGVEHLINIEDTDSYLHLKLLRKENDQTNVLLKKYHADNKIKEKRCELEDNNDWIYLEEHNIESQPSEICKKHIGVIKKSLCYISSIDAQIVNAFEAFRQVRAFIDKTPIVKKGQAIVPLANDKVINVDNREWKYPYFQVNTQKNNMEPAIWIYVDTAERALYFGISKNDDNGVFFAALNDIFLKKMEIDQPKIVDGEYTCGPIMEKEAFEKATVADMFEKIKDTLEIYGKLVDSYI